jgi:hypothetical protein
MMSGLKRSNTMECQSQWISIAMGWNDAPPLVERYALTPATKIRCASRGSMAIARL